MKRNKREQMKTILENIKKNYYSRKGELRPDPSRAKYMNLAMVVIAFLLAVAEIAYLVTRNDIALYFLVVLFLVFLVGLVFHVIIESGLKEFREEKNKEIRKFLKEAIGGEAKKYGVTDAELSVYLLKSYRSPLRIRILCNVITIIFTGFAVFYLPGYDQVKHGIIEFAILSLSNIAISLIASAVIKRYEQFDSFDFFIVRPHTEAFEKIENKLKEME